MKTAPLPPNESERLAALARYNILDTPPESAFDELTRLAAQICDTPMAAMSLVDRDRQWCKSRVGWEVVETPRRISICAHAILGDELFEVEDLCADERFVGSPLLEGRGGLRFYAGMPLATADGYNLGTLSVLHWRPGRLTEEQRKALQILAHQVMTQLELRRRLDDLARALEEQKEIEHRLEDSESFYQTLVESLPQNILRKDARGRFTFANRKFCQSVGRSLPELVGKTDFDLFPPELASKYHRDDLRVMATQENLDTIEAHQTPQGEKLFVHVLKTPLYGAQGEVAGIQGIFWDVTQRKKIEEALAYERDLLRALLDNIPDRIYFKDVHSRFLRCSTSLTRYLGLDDPRQVIGKTDFDFHPRELAQEFYTDEQRIILTGKPLISKLERQQNAEGEEVWASVTKVPIYSQAGAVTGLIGISRDVTRLKQTERELEKARDAALESVRAKSQFLANISHEIRTPMNAITGMTSLLKMTPLSMEQQEYAETIGDSTATLLALINEILDYSKIEAGKIRLEVIEFDLREAVESTSKMLADHAQKKGLELVCWMDHAVPGRLWGDPARFRQVLANLLSNAVKFTEQGEVLVRVMPCGEADQSVMVRVAVHDTGIGIPEEALSQIFEAFTQADGSTTRKYGGTGLGLTISRHLVELMGGEMGVESEHGQGSCFWFKIPFQCRVGGEQEPAQTGLESLCGKRVLVVDDSATNRQMLLDQLRYWRMEPAEAGSHAEALAILAEAVRGQRPFDVVLLDLEMPQESGLNLASAIKSAAITATCRVVAMTSFRGRVSVSDMRAAGISGRLIKPLRICRLGDCLVRVLQSEGENDFEHPETGGQDEPPLPSAARRTEPVSILLAEDNGVNQRVALRQLKKLGYVADAVVNGAEVLKAMKQKVYDIILMDCQMPEMDGYEASRRIRQAQAASGLESGAVPYIIALTANTLEGDRERCLGAGMNDYLSKPIEINDLEEVLNRAQGQARTSGQTRTAAPKSPPSESVPALDRAVLDALRALKSEHDPDPLSELVGLYLKDALPRLEKIAAGLLAGDAPAVAAAAHSLKGSSNNLGARRLGELCSRLEKEGKAGNLETAATIWPAVREEFQRVKEALQRELHP